MYYKLEKPDISKITPKEIVGFLQDEESEKALKKSFYPEYLYWDKLKYKELAKKFKPEVAWAAIKFMRDRGMHKNQSVIQDEQKKNFFWLSLPWLDEFLHKTDMELGGSLLSSARDLDEKERRRFIARGVMEEAIASSQLEGANTSRRAAKMLLREGRKPVNRSEQMIVNNYQAMLHVEDALKDISLSLDVLKELHAMLTKKTMRDPKDEGRFRTDEDGVIVHNEIDGTIYHIAPKEEFMHKELKRLVEYANDELSDAGFVHPVFKAIMLHFWIGYLHPFVDGNGRLARALFYWYLLKKGYWGFAYLPLSTIIKNSPNQYGMAYVYAEQDDNDLTYFLDYNARKIKQALKEFREYEERTLKTNTRMVKTARAKYGMNDRQVQLVKFYQKNKDEGVSVVAHMRINAISRATAIADLKKLEQMEFVSKKKIGRKVFYYATDKIESLFSD